ncbi:histidine ammonia-lyase [Paenibacillus montanisoli]|uniref:Histidine ammonia-lyase n=1 Tax=Paenibacillus montanisoli TaxID=2081970 RepID=A0A328TYF8_9BACL|nr:histidine ammonia-lyase [Paenibacillus montanisoli]RAP74792.1 histidine ammonia-lyase [Paenibacillus montanisoli]
MAISQVVISDEHKLTVQELVAVARGGAKVTITDGVANNIKRSRAWVDSLDHDQRTVYGVNTGIGELCKTRISPEEAATLSRNIVMSHACGVGEPLAHDQVRSILFSAIANFCQGRSGVRLETVNVLLDLLNKQVVPWVPSQGSVGYLTHMAHIALVTIGLGKAYYEGQLLSGREAMNRAGIPLLALQAKEGLSLVNGTVCMTGISALAVYDAMQLAKWADIAGAMSFEALKGTRHAFDPRVQRARPFKGQSKVAANLLRLVEGSEVAEKYKDYRVQDALSIRSMPQIHGACRDKIEHALETVTIELNAATDNPLIFADEEGGEAISACNAHGEPIALTMDMLAIAVSELANVSERRLDRLVNPHLSELPAFLVAKSGVNSGFMIPQYVAASLVAENKVLAHPISVDSIPTSAFQEDHVSMGTPAAIKAARVVSNSQKIIAVELLAATQAVEFHKPLRLGQGTGAMAEWIRSHIPAWLEDRVFYPDLHEIIAMVERADLVERLEEQIGQL